MHAGATDSSLLDHAARLYLGMDSPRFKAVARRALDTALSMSAEDDAPHHLDRVRAVAGAFPAARREELLKQLDEMAGSYQDNLCRHATLFSIPVIISTNQPTADLTLDEVNEICASMRRLKLVGDDVDVQLLPWLTAEPPYLDNPIAQRRLVQDLTYASAEEEMVREMFNSPRTAVESRPLNMSAEIERVAEALPAFVPGAPCLRYLTLALVAEEGRADVIFQRLRLNTNRSPVLDQWLVDIGATLLMGGYQEAIAQDPVRICQARAAGELSLVIAQGRRFIREAIRIHGNPQACQLQIQPGTDDGLKSDFVRLVFCRAGEELDQLVLGLPGSGGHSRATGLVVANALSLTGLKLRVGDVAISSPEQQGTPS